MRFISLLSSCILLVASVVAKDVTTKVPGWSLVKSMADKGYYVFADILEYTGNVKDLESRQLAYFAKMAYEDLHTMIESYDYQGLEKPEQVALLLVDNRMYISSTLTRNLTAGAWNPGATNKEVRKAIYQCQARILAGVGDKQPENCAEAMALQLYYASHQDKKDEPLPNAQLTVWGKLGNKADTLTPCDADRNNEVAFANAYGCSSMLKKLTVKALSGIDWRRGKEEYINNTEPKKVCL